MQNNGGGDVVSPFSCFTDPSKVSALLKEKARSASPTTVANIIVLPNSQNKRGLKNYLREKLFAANHDIRSVLYKSLIKRVECNKSMFSSNLYEDFAAENFTDVTGINDIPLPSFVQYEDIAFYCLNANGRLTLYKILACFGFHFPQITYSPLLAIAISLLLHYDDNPAQVFSQACRLVFANSKFTHYLDIDRTEADASALVLKDLSQRFTASSHKSLLSLTSDPLTVYNEWIRCLFNGLPFVFVVVLFDMYLLEGYKSLYRVSLAILKYYRKIGVSNASDIVSAVFQFVKEIETTVSIPLLFRKAFSFKLPPSKEIKKLHRRIRSSLIQQPSAKAETKPYRNPWDYLSLVRDVRSEIVNETLLSTLYCSIPERVALNRPRLVFSTNTNGYNMNSFYSCVEEHEPTILLIKTVNDEVIGAYLSASWSERKDTKGYFGTGETFIFSLLPEAKIHKWIELQAPAVPEEAYHDPHKPKVLPPVKPPGGTTKGGKGVTLPPIHHDTPITTPVTSATKFSSQESVTLPPLVGTSSSNVQSSVEKTINAKSEEKSDMFMMADESGLVIGGGKGYGIFLDSQLHKGLTQNCATFDNRPLVASGTFICATVEVLGFD